MRGGETRPRADGEDRSEFDILAFPPTVRSWMPLLFRDWLVPPTAATVLGGVVVVVAWRLAADPSSPGSIVRPAIGWLVSGAALAVTGVVFGVASWPAYRFLTERFARRSRRVALISASALAVVMLVAAAVGGSSLLAYLAVAPTTR